MGGSASDKSLVSLSAMVAGSESCSYVATEVIQNMVITGKTVNKTFL